MGRHKKVGLGEATGLLAKRVRQKVCTQTGLHKESAWGKRASGWEGDEKRKNQRGETRGGQGKGRKGKTPKISKKKEKLDIGTPGNLDFCRIRKGEKAAV